MEHFGNSEVVTVGNSLVCEHREKRLEFSVL